MLKNILTFFLLITFSSFSQKITEKPIYKGTQSLTIKEFETGAIAFLYQDDEYKYIVSITSFYVNSREQALELIEKAIFILEMAKTDKDQNIEDKIGALQIRRYGFDQKTIHIFNKEMKSLNLDLKELQKIKQALESYSYKFQKETKQD